VSRSTISTFQLFEKFPDEATAREYLEKRLWKNGPQCPKCKGTKNVSIRTGKDGFYMCNQCRFEFSVRTGTIFGRSHVPLHKWLYAMYLLVTARKGISSMQLAKEIGVRQGTAWFIHPKNILRVCARKEKTSPPQKIFLDKSWGVW
jgi:transposase-like protein